MTRYRCFLLILMLISCPLFANSGDLDSITREVYQQTGLSSSQVPYNHFEQAYHRYLSGLQGGEFNKPIISFVNFTLPSGQKRFFLVDVSTGGARLLHETYVTHGLNSGPPPTAQTFGNVPESYKSSLGFFKVAEEYQGNNGRSIRIDGLSGDLNNNARRRLVVLHSGNYVSISWVERNGFAGRSLGCFVIPYSVRDPIFDVIVNGSMLYAFYGGQGGEFNGSTQGLYDVARANTQGSGANITPGTPAPLLSDHPNFSGAEPSMMAQGQAGDHMNLTPGTGVDGAGSLDYDGDGEPDGFEQDDPQINSDGDAPLRGNEAFERCQAYADRPWGEVVQRTQAGDDPHQFFQGSWLDLEREAATGDDITYSAGAAAASNHLGVVNECAAMATIGDPNNFTREDPNAVEVLRSQDGEVECRYHGAEGVDFTRCRELIEAHDALSQAEADLHRNQSESFQTAGEAAVQGLQTGVNIQGNSSVIASDLARGVEASAAEREQFQTARLGEMASRLAAMPNYRSLLSKCHERTSRFPNGALADYKAFMTTIPDGTFAVPDMGDACKRMLGRLDVKYIQNKRAKDQAKKVLEKLGYKIEELQGQQGELQRQREAIDHAGLKGAEIPDYHLKDLKKFDGDTGEDREDSESKKIKGAKSSSRLPSSTSFSYPKFRPEKKRKTASINLGAKRKQGISHGIIAFHQQTRSQQLKENTREFLRLLRAADSAKLLPFMQANGLTLKDLEYAYQKNILSKEVYERLKADLAERLGRVTKRRNVDYDIRRGEGNREWQIEKDSNKSLFDIISNRYFKQTHLSQ